MTPPVNPRRRVRTFRGRVVNPVPWADLSVERASAFGLAWGRCLQAVNEAGEEFLAVYGVVARGGAWNVALLDLATRTAYAATAADEAAARDLAESVVIAMLTCACAQAALANGLEQLR